MITKPFFETLQNETSKDRACFLTIPLVEAAIQGNISLASYLQYLEQAYHHVKHTCPLLATSLSHCDRLDAKYREALFEYIEEERGHEEWILQDISDLGGDADAVRSGNGDDPVRIMIGYAYFAVERVSPYAMLGMVYVLEGMSVAVAQRAATGIANALGSDGRTGFSYLKSHGSLDQDHIRFFERLVNQVATTSNSEHIIDTSRIMYGLFGDVLRRVGDHTLELEHVA